MTKTQAKKEALRLVERLVWLQGEIDILRDEFETFQSDLEETIDSIEPYEDKDDLTPQQEERLEWFEELHERIEEFAEDTLSIDLEDPATDLEDFIEC